MSIEDIAYPFICWHIFGLFMLFDHDKKHYDECSHATLRIDKSFHCHLWRVEDLEMNSLAHMITM